MHRYLPIPILEFRDTHGLEQSTPFATFRVGGAWAKRLGPGERVLLSDGRYGIGVARVVSIYVAPARLACEAHGAHSHLEFGRSEPGAGERRFASLQKLYGPRIVTETRPVSVIYLRRVKK
jgi:hypothetical protein